MRQRKNPFWLFPPKITREKMVFDILKTFYGKGRALLPAILASTCYISTLGLIKHEE